MRALPVLAGLVLISAIVACADHGEGPTAANVSPAEVEHSHTPATVPAARNFVAPLEGDQEVPVVDTRARGLAKLQLERNGDALDYRLIVANIEDVMMAHIHLAPVGENGGIVVWLYPVDGPPPKLIPGRTDGILAAGTITTDDLVGDLEDNTLDDLLAEIHSGNAYVNVHTSDNPGGEIRGQLFVAGPSH